MDTYKYYRYYGIESNVRYILTLDREIYPDVNEIRHLINLDIIVNNIGIHEIDSKVQDLEIEEEKITEGIVTARSIKEAENLIKDKEQTQKMPQIKIKEEEKEIKELSFSAYLHCKDIEDTKEMRDKIIDSECALEYCKDVKDRKEVRDRITDDYEAFIYCRDVKDRKEVRDRILGSKNVFSG